MMMLLRALGLVVSLTLGACNGDDDELRPLTRDDLIGEWNIQSATIIAAAEVSDPGAPTVRIEGFEIVIDETAATWVFSEDDTYVVNGTARNRWEAIGPAAEDDLDLFDEIVDLREEGTFELDGESLRIIPADSAGISGRLGSPSTYDVESYDGSTLVLTARSESLLPYLAFPDDVFDSELVLRQ